MTKAKRTYLSVFTMRGPASILLQNTGGKEGDECGAGEGVEEKKQIKARWAEWRGPLACCTRSKNKKIAVYGEKKKRDRNRKKRE